MEKPIPPNPDTMTDEEFDKWLEAERTQAPRKKKKPLGKNLLPRRKRKASGEKINLLN